MIFFYRLRMFIQLFPRSCRHWWQRRIRGWDDSETWSLDYSLGKLILPRLKRFRELNNGYPDKLSEHSWDACIDKMIYAFELISDEEFQWNSPPNDPRWKDVEEGLTLFTKYYHNLWW